MHAKQLGVLVVDQVYSTLFCFWDISHSFLLGDGVEDDEGESTR